MTFSTPRLKRYLKAVRAHWCDLHEPIVATLSNDPLLDYGVTKGILKSEKGGPLGENRIHYYFTIPKGIEFRDNMRKNSTSLFN
jgi:hypothetical protein